MDKIRSVRIFGLAVFDLSLAIVGTALLMLLFWYIHFRDMAWWPFVVAGILLAIPIGIFVHAAFGINTRLNHALGLSHRVKK